MSENKVQMFTERYRTQHTPWDTGITPPEIVEVITELSPGRGIDLGCGTGTNVRYLLEHAWEADGVDFVPEAVEVARTKLAAFPQEKYGVFCHDVSRLEDCDGLRPPYDLAIDIGCGHGVYEDVQALYAKGLAALLKPGATFMLFAHQPTEDRTGWTPDDVRRLFAADFEIVWQVLNDDTTTGRPSGWYRLKKK